MNRGYLCVLAGLLPGVLACSFEVRRGSGEPPSAGSGGSAAADPSRVESSPLETTDVGKPDGVDIGVEEPGGAIEVTSSVFEALLDAEHGDALASLPVVDGMSAFVATFTSRLPVSGAPNALCARLTIPVVTSGCAAVDPTLVDGGSYDVDFDGGAEPLAGLEPMIDRSELCGLGTHPVKLTVYDYDGNNSTCIAPVTLCDPTQDEGCPADTTKNVVAISDDKAPAITCQWIWTRAETPTSQEQQTLSQYSYQEKGGGPRYWRTSKDVEPRSCLNPPDHEESFNETLGGDVDVDMNVVCADSKGAIVMNPECTSNVEFRSFYRSEARAATWDGLACGGNAVEAFAQDEVSFVVNNQAVFNKAVAVQNGTEASTSVTFSLGGELGTSKEGVSANATVGFGWTRNFTDKTANKTDFLFADGLVQQATPVSARLQARGRTYLKVHDRTWGISDVRTGHWLIAVAGSSTCPAAGRLARARRQHYTNVLVPEGRQDVTAANHFFETRRFSIVIPQ